MNRYFSAQLPLLIHLGDKIGDGISPGQHRPRRLCVGVSAPPRVFSVNDEGIPPSGARIQPGNRQVSSFHRIASWELDHDELQSARQVVSAFDLSLECVPASVLAQAHRYAQANFNAPVQQRLSMTALVDDDSRMQPNSLDAAAA